MNGRSRSDYLDLNGCRVGGFTDMGRECDRELGKLKLVVDTQDN
ncbi:MAG: hypothetical protein RIM23_17485 [Coleofasciculus sp. G3-WIS-01]